MSWTDPCGNCGQHRADCECERYTRAEKHTCKYCAYNCKKKSEDTGEWGSCEDFTLATKGVQTTIPEYKWDGRRTHCCREHGCKYGQDDCPVVLDLIGQSYPCEQCSDINDFLSEYQRNLYTSIEGFDEWYEKEQGVFHCGQFDDKQIAHSAYLEGGKVMLKLITSQKNLDQGFIDIIKKMKLIRM